VKKKILFSFLIVFFLVGSVLANDVAYVLRELNNPDDAIISALNELGYSYELVDDDNIKSMNFNDYKMILIPDEPIKNYEFLPITEKASLIMNTYYVDEWKIAKYTGSYVTSGKANVRILENNMITEGINPPVKVYDTSNIPLYNLPYPFKRARGIENIVSTDNYHEYPVIGIINPGGELYSDGIALARTAFFGITETQYWSQETRILFKNTLRWVMVGEDGDNDGFYYEEDCDDSNSLINPDAEEIPYNAIDEDCDGFDKADLDGDGFCLQGYAIQNKNLQCPEETGSIGSDCDDENADYNPNSEDVYKNCKNDAPVIISPDKKIIGYENETLEIVVEATDPEDDKLSFSINDSRFQQNENIFTWHTNYDDEGVYFFEINVSDGIESSVKEIEVEVKNKNQIPVCSEIPEVNWSEDEEISIDLKEYCSDPDGDSLIYTFYNTSQDHHISLDSLENGIANFSSEENWNGEDWIVFKVSDNRDYILTNEIKLKVIPENDPPVFLLNLPNISLKENRNLTNYLDLRDYFYDIDSDELIFEVIGNHNIDIDINNGMVSFYPKANWVGEENIVFNASDGEFAVNSNAIVLKVLENQAPVILDYSPKSAVRILENTDEEFSIIAFDEEDELMIEWFVDDVKAGEGDSYVFNKDKGNYAVRVVVSDGKHEAEHSWEVFVGDVSDFACEEIGGYIIKENEICLGELFATSDSNLFNCCSIKGQPKFSDAERCESVNDSLKIRIEEPDENDKFKTGESIKGKIKIENDFDEDLDLDAEIYLYDITEDSEIVKYEDSVSVDEGESEKLRFEFDIPEDINEDDDFAIFVKAIDEDYCNEGYNIIKIEREKHKVMIEKVDMDSEIECGKYLNFDVRVKNLGSRDENVYLLIENSELNILEKTDEFELEKYDEDDFKNKMLNIKIPKNIKEGDYEFKISAIFNGEEDFIIKNVSVECKEVETETQEIEKIVLNGEREELQIKDNKLKIIIGVIMLAVLIILFLLLRLLR